MNQTIRKLVYKEDEKGVRTHRILIFKPGHPDYDKELKAREDWVKAQQEQQSQHTKPILSIFKK